MFWFCVSRKKSNGCLGSLNSLIKSSSTGNSIIVILTSENIFKANKTLHRFGKNDSFGEYERDSDILSFTHYLIWLSSWRVGVCLSRKAMGTLTRSILGISHFTVRFLGGVDFIQRYVYCFTKICWISETRPHRQSRGEFHGPSWSEWWKPGHSPEWVQNQLRFAQDLKQGSWSQEMWPALVEGVTLVTGL